MTNAQEQMALAMRFTVLSRAVLEEIRKAGACVEPHPSLDTTEIQGLGLFAESSHAFGHKYLVHVVSACRNQPGHHSEAQTTAVVSTLIQKQG